MYKCIEDLAPQCRVFILGEIERDFGNKMLRQLWTFSGTQSLISNWFRVITIPRIPMSYYPSIIQSHLKCRYGLAVLNPRHFKYHYCANVCFLWSFSRLSVEQSLCCGHQSHYADGFVFKFESPKVFIGFMITIFEEVNAAGVSTDIVDLL